MIEKNVFKILKRTTFAETGWVPTQYLAQIFRQLMPSTYQEGIEKFIIHIKRLSREEGIPSRIENDLTEQGKEIGLGFLFG